MREPGRLLSISGFEMDPLEMLWWECAWWVGNTVFGIGAQAALVGVKDVLREEAGG